MSEGQAVVFVIDDDESMRRSLATLLGHAQDAGEIDRGPRAHGGPAGGSAHRLGYTRV